mmetsp:Transcript_39651/g.47660  ORF Transcript_39651/g.47660 Transcript_39651/m.47660 type:complete len:401 (-) Transcript_39651:99-1301(-)
MMRTASLCASIVLMQRVSSGVARSEKLLFVSRNIISASKNIFQTNTKQKWNNAMKNSNHENRWFSNSPPATTAVLNPLTKRNIKINQPIGHDSKGKKGNKTKWDEFMESGWVMHGGTMIPIDTRSLLNFQNNVDCKDFIYGGNDVSDIGASNVIDGEDWYRLPPKITFRSLAECDDGNATTNIEAKDSDVPDVTDEVLFVHKPSGLLTVPGRGPEKADSLISRIMEVAGKKIVLKPCHRLDRDTSGILVFGLSADTHRHISMQFENRSARKTYIALVAGHPEIDSGMIDMPIGKRMTESGFSRWAIGGEKAREARTSWRICDRLEVNGAKYSRLELFPLTGRGQQLRLHMNAIGHAILGDSLHAPLEVARATPRLCLHASSLVIDIGKGISAEVNSAAPF